MKLNRKNAQSAAQKALYPEFIVWRKDKSNHPDAVTLMQGIKDKLKEFGLPSRILDTFPDSKNLEPEEAENRLLVYWDLSFREGRFYGTDYYLESDGKFWPALMRQTSITLNKLKQLAVKRRARAREEEERNPIAGEKLHAALALEYSEGVIQLYESGRVSKVDILATHHQVGTKFHSLGERMPVVSKPIAKAARSLQ